MNCVITAKNMDELEDLVHLAESLDTKISFEPLHESFGIDEKVWETLESGISHDTKKPWRG